MKQEGIQSDVPKWERQERSEGARMTGKESTRQLATIKETRKLGCKRGEGKEFVGKDPIIAQKVWILGHEITAFPS